MVYLDVREGVSGDMLLSALLGLLDEKDRAEAVARLDKGATNMGLRFNIIEMADFGDVGLGISYTGTEPSWHGLELDKALSLMSRIQGDYGSESETAKEILMAIFAAEAEAHGETPESVHLHEIGRPEGILNIAGIGLVADQLKRREKGRFQCSTITIGRGTVVISHGVIRVPAPASKILLRGLVHEEGTIPGERATPTGIAALKVLCKHQTSKLPKNPVRRSVGFGTKRFGGRLGRVVAYSTSSLTN